MMAEALGTVFSKMHGLGNDFVVIESTDRPFDPDPARLRHWADRRQGIGCDQVLVIEAAQDPGCDFAYRVFNADGSEVEQCGNGVRCVARWLVDRGWVEQGRFRLSSAAGPLEVSVDGGQVAVNMGAPRLSPEAVPILATAVEHRYPLTVQGRSLSLGAVSMGNPHGVLKVADVAQAEVAELGPAIQALDAFPRGVNVGFLQVVDSGHVRLRVFERGVGETRACGTGACAAVVCGRLWQLLDERVRVSLPGGDLVIAWAGGDAPVWMSGPAEYAFEGRITDQ